MNLVMQLTAMILAVVCLIGVSSCAAQATANNNNNNRCTISSASFNASGGSAAIRFSDTIFGNLQVGNVATVAAWFRIGIDSATATSTASSGYGTFMSDENYLTLFSLSNRSRSSGGGGGNDNSSSSGSYSDVTFLTLRLNIATGLLELTATASDGSQLIGPSSGKIVTGTGVAQLTNEVWHLIAVEVNAIYGLITVWIDATVDIDARFPALAQAGMVSAAMPMNLKLLRDAGALAAAAAAPMIYEVGHYDINSQQRQQQQQQQTVGSSPSSRHFFIGDILYTEYPLGPEEVLSWFSGVRLIDPETNLQCGGRLEDSATKVFRVVQNTTTQQQQQPVQSPQLIVSGAPAAALAAVVVGAGSLSSDVVLQLPPEMLVSLSLTLTNPPSTAGGTAAAQTFCGADQRWMLSRPLSEQLAGIVDPSLALGRTTAWQIQLELVPGGFPRPDPNTIVYVNAIINATTSSTQQQNKYFITSSSRAIDPNFLEILTFTLPQTLLLDSSLRLEITSTTAATSSSSSSSPGEEGNFCVKNRAAQISPARAVALQLDSVSSEMASIFDDAAETTTGIVLGGLTPGVDAIGLVQTTVAEVIADAATRNFSCILHSNNNNNNTILLPIQQDGVVRIPSFNLFSNGGGGHQSQQQEQEPALFRVCVFPKGLPRSVQAYPLPLTMTFGGATTTAAKRGGGGGGGVGAALILVATAPPGGLPLQMPPGTLLSLLHLGRDESSGLLTHADFATDYFAAAGFLGGEPQLRPRVGDAFLIDGVNAVWTPLTHDNDGVWGRAYHAGSGSGSSSVTYAQTHWIQYYAVALHNMQRSGDQEIVLRLRYATALRVYVDGETVFDESGAMHEPDGGVPDLVDGVTTRIRLRAGKWHQLLFKLYRSVMASGLQASVVAAGGGGISWAFQIPEGAKTNNNNDGSSSGSSSGSSGASSSPPTASPTSAPSVAPGMTTTTTTTTTTASSDGSGSNSGGGGYFDKCRDIDRAIHNGSLIADKTMKLCIPEELISTVSQHECFNLGCCNIRAPSPDGTQWQMYCARPDQNNNNNGAGDGGLKYRRDGRCGPSFAAPGAAIAECDAESSSGATCCSAAGYCGSQETDCACRNGCVDYRYAYATSLWKMPPHRCVFEELCKGCTCAATANAATIYAGDRTTAECRFLCEAAPQMYENNAEQCIAFTQQFAAKSPDPNRVQCNLHFTPTPAPPTSSGIDNCTSNFQPDWTVLTLNRAYCSGCRMQKRCSSGCYCSERNIKNLFFNSSTASLIANQQRLTEAECLRQCTLAPRCAAVSFEQASPSSSAICYFLSILCPTDKVVIRPSTSTSSYSEFICDNEPDTPNTPAPSTSTTTTIVSPSSSSSSSSSSSGDGSGDSGSSDPPLNPDEQRKLIFVPPSLHLGCYVDPSSTILAFQTPTYSDAGEAGRFATYTVFAPGKLTEYKCRQHCFVETGSLFFAMNGGTVCMCGLRLPAQTVLRRASVSACNTPCTGVNDDSYISNVTSGGYRGCGGRSHSDLYVIDAAQQVYTHDQQMAMQQKQQRREQKKSNSRNENVYIISQQTLGDCPADYYPFTANPSFVSVCYRVHDAVNDPAFVTEQQVQLQMRTFDEAADACLGDYAVPAAFDNVAEHRFTMSLPYAINVSRQVRDIIDANVLRFGEAWGPAYLGNSSADLPAKIVAPATVKQWLGGRLSAESGTEAFQWLDGTPWTFSRWKLGEPSALLNSGSAGTTTFASSVIEDPSSWCVSASADLPSTTTMGVSWRSSVCAQERLAFTCAKRIENSFAEQYSKRSVMLAEVENGPVACGTASVLLETAVGEWNLLPVALARKNPGNNNNNTNNTSSNSNSNSGIVLAAKQGIFMPTPQDFDSLQEQRERQTDSSSSSLSSRRRRRRLGNVNLTMFWASTKQRVTTPSFTFINSGGSGSGAHSSGMPLLYFGGAAFLQSTYPISATDNAFSVCAFVSPVSTFRDAAIVSQGLDSVADSTPTSDQQPPRVAWSLALASNRACFFARTTRVCTNVLVQGASNKRTKLHLCGVFDGFSAALFVDGRLVRRVQNVATPMQVPVSSRPVIVGAFEAPAAAGRVNMRDSRNQNSATSTATAVDPTRIFHGNIAELFIFRAAITDVDARFLATCVSSEEERLITTTTASSSSRPLSQLPTLLSGSTAYLPLYSLPLYRTADSVVTLSGHGLALQDQIVLSSACWQRNAATVTLYPSGRGPTAQQQQQPRKQLQSLSFLVPALLSAEDIYDVCVEPDSAIGSGIASAWSGVTLSVTTVDLINGDPESTSVDTRLLPVRVNLTGRGLAVGQAIALSFDSRCNMLLGVFPIRVDANQVSNNNNNQNEQDGGASTVPASSVFFDITAVERRTDVWFLCWLPTYSGSLSSSPAAQNPSPLLMSRTSLTITVVSDFETKRLAVSDGGSWTTTASDYINGRFIDVHNYVAACSPSRFGPAFVVAVHMGLFDDYYVPVSGSVSLCDAMTRPHDVLRYTSVSPLLDEYDGTVRSVPKNNDNNDNNDNARWLGGSPSNWPEDGAREYLSSWGVMDNDNPASSSASVGGCCANGPDETPAWYRAFTVTVFALNPATLYLNVRHPLPIAAYLDEAAPLVISILDVFGNVVSLDNLLSPTTSTAPLIFNISFSDPRMPSFTSSATTTATNAEVATNFTFASASGISVDDVITVTVSVVNNPQQQQQFQNNLRKASLSFDCRIVSRPTSIVNNNSDWGGENQIFPVTSGQPFAAQVLVLPFSDSSDMSRDLLWEEGGEAVALPQLGDNVTATPSATFAHSSSNNNNNRRSINTWDLTLPCAEQPGNCYGMLPFATSPLPAVGYIAFGLFVGVAQTIRFWMKLLPGLNAIVYLDGKTIASLRGATSATSATTQPHSGKYFALSYSAQKRIQSPGWQQVLIRIEVPGHMRSPVTSFIAPILTFGFDGSALAAAPQLPSRFPTGTRPLRAGAPIRSMLRAGGAAGAISAESFSTQLLLPLGGDDRAADPQPGAATAVPGFNWEEVALPMLATSWTIPSTSSSSASSGGNNNNNNNNGVEIAYLSTALYAMAEGAFSFSVNSSGPVEMWIDQHPLASCPVASGCAFVSMAQMTHGWHRLLVKFGSSSSSSSGSGSGSITIVPLQDGLAKAFSVPPELPSGAAIVDGPFLHMLQLLSKTTYNSTNSQTPTSPSSAPPATITSILPGIPTAASSSSPDPFPISPGTAPSPDEGVLRVELLEQSSGGSSPTPPHTIPLFSQWEPISTQHGIFGGRGIGGNFDSYFALVVYTPSNQTVSVQARFYSAMTMYLDGVSVFRSSTTTAFMTEMQPLPNVRLALTQGWHRLIFKLHAPIDFNLGAMSAEARNNNNNNVSLKELVGLCSEQKRDACGFDAYCPLPGPRPRLDGEIVSMAQQQKDVVMWAPVVETSYSPTSSTLIGVQYSWVQVGGTRTQGQCARKVAQSANSAMPPPPDATSIVRPIVACCGTAPSPPVLQVQLLDGHGLGWAYDTPSRRVVPATPKISIVTPTSNTPLVTMTTISVGARIFFTVDGSRPGPEHGTEYHIDEAGDDSSSTGDRSGNNNKNNNYQILGVRIRRNVIVTAVAIDARGRTSGLAVLFIPPIQLRRLRRRDTVANVAMQTVVDGGVDPGSLLFLLSKDFASLIELSNFGEAKALMQAGKSPCWWIMVDMENRVTIPRIQLLVNGGQKQQQQNGIAAAEEEYVVYAFQADPVVGPDDAPAEVLDGTLRVAQPSFSPNYAAVNQPIALHFSGNGGLVPADTIFFPPPYLDSCYDALCRYEHLTGATSLTRLSPEQEPTGIGSDTINSAVPTTTLTLFPMQGRYLCMCVLQTGGGARSDFSQWTAVYGGIAMTNDGNAPGPTSVFVELHARNRSVVTEVNPGAIRNGGVISFDGRFALPTTDFGGGAAGGGGGRGGGSSSIAADAVRVVFEEGKRLPGAAAPSCVSPVARATPTAISCRVLVDSSVSGLWRAVITIGGATEPVPGDTAAVLNAGVYLIPDSPLPLIAGGDCAKQSSRCVSGVSITLIGSRFDREVISNNIIDLEDAESAEHTKTLAKEFNDNLNLPITCTPLSVALNDDPRSKNNKSIAEVLTCRLAIPSAMQLLLAKYATPANPFIFNIVCRVTVGGSFASAPESRTGGSIIFGLGDNRRGWQAADLSGGGATNDRNSTGADDGSSGSLSDVRGWKLWALICGVCAGVAMSMFAMVRFCTRWRGAPGAVAATTTTTATTATDAANNNNNPTGGRRRVGGARRSANNNNNNNANGEEEDAIALQPRQPRRSSGVARTTTTNGSASDNMSPRDSRNLEVPMLSQEM